jgi:hypothetical protein
MVDRRVPGFERSTALAVTPVEVAAARLTVKRSHLRGTTVDPSIQAIANAKRMPVTEPPTEEKPDQEEQMEVPQHVRVK